MDLAAAIDVTARVSEETDRVVTPRRLMRAGVTRALIAKMISIRHLRRVLHGIYLVGESRLSQRQLLRVALMRAGSAGGLTAYSSLELTEVLWPRAGLATALTANHCAVGWHYTEVPMRETGDPGRIQLRRAQTAVVFEEVAGLLVTQVGRGLTDLVEFGGGGLLSIAWGQAEYRGLLDESHLRAEVGHRRPGSEPVAELVGKRRILTDASTDLRGKTELRWLHLMIEAGLPMPELNAPVEAGGTTYYVDYLFVEYGVAVELDSPEHLTPVRAAADHARDDDLDAVGIHTLRLIDSLALDDPEPHLRRVEDLLRRRGWPGPGRAPAPRAVGVGAPG